MLENLIRMSDHLIIRNNKRGHASANWYGSINQYNISEDITMTHNHYNYNSKEVARKLILAVSTAYLAATVQACSTTVSFSDGVIVGETAQREYNKRVLLKRFLSGDINEPDRARFQGVLDKEID